MTDPDIRTNAPENPKSPQGTLTTMRGRWLLGAGLGAMILAVGAAGGVGAARVAQNWQPQSVILQQPSPIAQIADGEVVAVKGQVAEIFGNKFILQDPSGRALIELGPRGERGNVVNGGDGVTVQGRFERGVIHAHVLTYGDGRSLSFDPPRPHPKKGPDKKGARYRDEGPEGRAIEAAPAAPPPPSVLPPAPGRDVPPPPPAPR